MITTTFKNKVATFFKDSVTEVVLNDSISIADFTVKDVSTNIARVNFVIAEGTGIIRKLQIKAGEEILSECEMYLEAEAEVQFSYRLEVKANG